MPTTRPIPMLTSMGPAESSSISINVSRRIRTIASGLISRSSRITKDQAANDQEPTIDQHKQQEFERQRNHRWGQHLHSHCEKNVGDDHIDNDERHKQ